MELIGHWGMAMVYEQDMELMAAETHYLQMIDLREKTQDTHDTLPALCAAATFFAARGLARETTLCAEVLAAMAAATGNTEALAALAYTLAETALFQNNAKEAVQQFRQAREHFEKLEVPVEQAKTELRLGIALVRAGQEQEAIVHLRNGYRIARKLGARPLASQMTGELEKLGATAEERRSPDAPERVLYGGLTSRQLEILKLMAAGLTNKEIAGKLFLSPRTVDMHVGHILERLDCRGRMEAVRKAEEMALLETGA
jgi:DNA-binding CsgD family transcriptional regulator